MSPGKYGNNNSHKQRGGVLLGVAAAAYCAVFGLRCVFMLDLESWNQRPADRELVDTLKRRLECTNLIECEAKLDALTPERSDSTRAAASIANTTTPTAKPHFDLLSHLPDCDMPQSPLSLTDLARQYKPIKFWKYAHNNYDRFYPRFLEGYRRKRFRMLEIGLASGQGSLLWKDYFPCVKLVGLEYDAKHTQTAGARSILTIQGDQGNATFLRGDFLRQAGGPFDVIVDDGGHHYEQQRTSYEVLFDVALEPGGIYLLEDVETSYWKTGEDLYGKRITRGGQSEPHTMVNSFKRLVDVVNKKFYDNSAVVFGPVDHWVATLSFGSNLVVLQKKDKSHCFAERSYIWPERLAADCPAGEQTPEVLRQSAMYTYCGEDMVQQDRVNGRGRLERERHPSWQDGGDSNRDHLLSNS